MWTPEIRRYLSGLGLDVRLAWRFFWHQPGVASASIALIALAIAAATSIFSVVNGVALQPLPRVHMDGLVRVMQTDSRDSNPGLWNEGYFAWKDRPATIVGLATWNDVSLSLERPDGLEIVKGASITASLFPLLGVSPILGTHFTEEQETSDDAIILSYGFWRERFAGAPDVVGTRMPIGGRSRTIVGVMPNGFQFPDREARVWLAARPPKVVERESRTAISITLSKHNALARLKPGVTADQAAAATVQYLAQFLFGVAPFDVQTFVTAGVAIAAVALAGCAIPAWRVSRTDLIAALRR